MLKRIFYSKYRVPKYLCFTITLLCWSLAFFQSAAKQAETRKAVPAFQNETLPDTNSVPAFQNATVSKTEKSQTWEIFADFSELTKEAADSYCQNSTTFPALSYLINKTAPDCVPVTSHSSSDFSDFYFYSSSLQKQFQISPITSTGSNVQIVFVWNPDGSCKHIYIGTPCIEYNF